MAYTKKYTKKPYSKKSTKKFTKKAPLKKVPLATKKYVERMVDRTIPDMHFKQRYELSVPLDGPIWAPIFPANCWDMTPLPFTPNPSTSSTYYGNNYGIINFAESYRLRGGFDQFKTVAENFPNLRLKMKGLYVSGQVSIPLVLSNTPWAKVKIFVFEDKSFDQHQTGGDGEVTPPGSNILQDRNNYMTGGVWDSEDISFTPSGKYTDLIASFNTSRFKLLGVTNVHVEQSTQDPTRNLRKFGFKCKHPAYLKWRQSDGDGSNFGLYPLSGTPTNFKPIVMAYAVASDGSTSPVSLQLDVSLSIEPAAN